MTETKPQVVDTVPESYVRTSGLQFIDGVLHQLFVSGHTGGEGVWVAVPGQSQADIAKVYPTFPGGLTAAAVPPAGSVAPSVGGTETSAPGPQSPSPLPPPAPVPTEQGMQVQSPGQEG